MIAVFEYDMHDAEVATHAGVQAHVGEGDEVAVEFELGALHVVCADWRVVADLLVAQGNAF